MHSLAKSSPRENKQECADRPLITVGVTTYKRPEMLRECLASILNQSYPNIEIIVGNDCVEQPVTFESLGLRSDHSIRIVNHPKTQGAFDNNLSVLREAKGDWFTWLADDDLMHPDYLQIAYEALSKCKVAAVFANYAAGPDPRDSFPTAISTVTPQILSGPQFIDEYTSRRIKTIGNSGVFKRELIKDLWSDRTFRTGGRLYWDTFMPIFAATLGKVVYVDLDLVFLRTHEYSYSAGMKTSIEQYSCAQDDFLIEFERHCKNVLEVSEYEGQLVNMLEWFAADGWHVICRRHPGVYQRISGFYRYSIDTIVPNLPASSRVAFGLFIIKLIIGDSMRYLASRALRKVKFWA